MTAYGTPPVTYGRHELPGFVEYMHYMYLPVIMPGQRGPRIPERLAFAKPMIERAVANEEGQFAYAYVTARRGYATPGNPLNRPGWHADGFGTNDINYVWTDRWPTYFAIQEFTDIDPGHAESMDQFEAQVSRDSIVTYPDCEFMRLDPFVVHSAPEIPAPGGERSFFKISFSDARYNLAGNSHNYLFDYEWHMYGRNEARNDPSIGRNGCDATLDARPVATS